MALSGKHRHRKYRQKSSGQTRIYTFNRPYVRLIYKLLLVFCIFFIVSFLGGIIRGYYVTKQPDHLINFIKKNVFLSADKEKNIILAIHVKALFINII